MQARILLIEDNAANLELASYLLRMGGHTVLTALDGQEGLRIALQEHPDLIICDLQMPVMDGFEFLARYREQQPLHRPPVVAVTAFSMPGDHSRILLAGFDGYLSKPIDPEAFVQQMESYLQSGPGSRGRQSDE